MTDEKKGVVVDLMEVRRRRREYRKQVHRVVHALRTMQTPLYDMMTTLALLGGLGDALADEPIGATVRIGDAELLATGDVRVAALVKLNLLIDETVLALYEEDK